MEDLHGDPLFAIVFTLELDVLDCNVLFYVFARQLNLFVLSGTIQAVERPVRDGRWNAGKDDKENICLEPSAVHKRQD